jgi:hypothetical protein
VTYREKHISSVSRRKEKERIAYIQAGAHLQGLQEVHREEG